MKRIFPVLLALILVFSMMVVPTFAAESYVFNYDETEQYMAGPELPAGTYTVQFVCDGVALYSSAPFCVSYSPFPTEPSSLYCEGVLDLGQGLSADYLLFFDGNLCIFLSEDAHFTPDTSLVFTPVQSTPSLSDIVDSDMMSSVLDEIVVLLPVVLVVIIGFIAIRKGISFLRSTVSGA